MVDAVCTRTEGNVRLTSKRGRTFKWRKLHLWKERVDIDHVNKEKDLSKLLRLTYAK